MDEAFSALDPLVRHEMQDELLDLQANVKKTIIFITHDLNEALRLGDRIAIMKDGQLQQIGTGEEILTNPANGYVENFVEDVDRSKVLNAETIMIPGFTINADTDGPNVALHRMSEEEVSGLVAVDANRKFAGYITSDAAVAARREKKNLRDVLTEMPTVTPDTLVADIMPIIYDAHTPVAVVDENQKLHGIIIRGAVIEALAQTEGDNND